MKKSHVCTACNGIGAIRVGYHEAAPGEPTYDILMHAYEDCPRCLGQGYYVSRAEAGLASTLQP